MRESTATENVASESAASPAAVATTLSRRPWPTLPPRPPVVWSDEISRWCLQTGTAGLLGLCFGAGRAFLHREPLAMLTQAYTINTVIFAGTVFGVRNTMLHYSTVRYYVPPEWELKRSTSAAAAGLTGWFYTSLFSGPGRGFLGACVWTAAGYALQYAVDEVEAAREARGGEVRAQRDLRKRLTPAEVAEFETAVAVARSERAHAINAAGSAARLAAMEASLPRVPTLEEWVEDVEEGRRRSGNSGVASADANGGLSRSGTAAATTSGVSAGPPPSAAAAAPAADTGAPATRPLFVWPSWLPLQRVLPGTADTSPQLKRLSTRLREVDELLGIPPEQTAADIRSARGLPTEHAGPPHS